jgi:hypothetical protein
MNILVLKYEHNDCKTFEFMFDNFQVVVIDLH